MYSPPAVPLGAGSGWPNHSPAPESAKTMRELAAFHQSVVTGAAPPTSGPDGLRDIALCQAIIECHRRQAPVDQPSSVG